MKGKQEMLFIRVEVPARLWKYVKIEAVQRGVTVSQVLSEILASVYSDDANTDTSCGV